MSSSTISGWLSIARCISRMFLLVLICLTLLGTGAAKAQTLSWAFGGVVNEVDSLLQGGGVSVGDTLSGSVTFNLSIAPMIGNDSSRFYLNLTHLVLDVGSYHYDGNGGFNGYVALYGPPDSAPGMVMLNGLPLSGTINGYRVGQFKMQLDTPTAPGMTPTLTPTSVPILSNYTGRVFDAFLSTPDGIPATYFWGTMTQLTLVPEPTSLTLVLIGVAMLLAVCRKRFCL